MIIRVVRTAAIVAALLLATSPGLAGAKSFTQEIWEASQPFYQKILQMPFNRELADGTLDERVFREYIIQDYYFLQNFRKVYGILLAKAPDERAAKFVAEGMKGIDEEIGNVHTKFFKKYGIGAADLAKSAPSPATEFYNSYLVKTAVLDPFEVGLISILPCHWVYFQIGFDIKKSRSAPNGKYQDWLDGYGSTPWETSETKRFVDLIEAYAQKTTAETRGAMRASFDKAMSLEYMFWDGAYKGLQWVH